MWMWQINQLKWRYEEIQEAFSVHILSRCTCISHFSQKSKWKFSRHSSDFICYLSARLLSVVRLQINSTSSTRLHSTSIETMDKLQFSSLGAALSLLSRSFLCEGRLLNSNTSAQSQVAYYIEFIEQHTKCAWHGEGEKRLYELKNDCEMKWEKRVSCGTYNKHKKTRPRGWR